MGEVLNATCRDLGQLVCPENCWLQQLQDHSFKLVDCAEENVCEGIANGSGCSVQSSVKSSAVTSGTCRACAILSFHAGCMG